MIVTTLPMTMRVVIKMTTISTMSANELDGKEKEDIQNDCDNFADDKEGVDKDDHDIDDER